MSRTTYPYTLTHPIENMTEVNGRWVPSIPLKAPIDVRWCCFHEWMPHVHPDGSESHVDYDCINCGAATEAGSWPKPGCWEVRRWLALRLFPYGRAVRRNLPEWER